MNAVGIKSSMLKIQFFSCYDNKNKILAEHNSTVKARFFLKNTWRKNVLGISCEAQIIHEWSNWGNILLTITENIAWGYNRKLFTKVKFQPIPLCCTSETYTTL